MIYNQGRQIICFSEYEGYQSWNNIKYTTKYKVGTICGIMFIQPYFIFEIILIRVGLNGNNLILNFQFSNFKKNIFLNRFLHYGTGTGRLFLYVKKAILFVFRKNIFSLQYTCERNKQKW